MYEYAYKSKLMLVLSKGGVPCALCVYTYVHVDANVMPPLERIHMDWILRTYWILKVKPDVFSTKDPFSLFPS